MPAQTPRTPSPSARPVVLALLAALTVMAVGCTDDFEPKSAVLYTRIIGIQASVPRMVFGDRTEFRALVVSPDPSDQVELLWEVCPLTGADRDGYPCVYPTMPPELVASLRGEGESFSFTYAIPFLIAVDTFCEALAASAEEIPAGLPIPDCTQGYPARVRLTAHNVTTGEEVAAVKTLYLTPSAATPTTNANPLIRALEPAADAPATARVGEAFPVRCRVDASALESFLRFDETTPRVEEALLSWYVRGGKLDKDLTLYSEEYGTTDEAEENDVVPDAVGTTSVWCVVRDGRGGATWEQLDITVE